MDESSEMSESVSSQERPDLGNNEIIEPFRDSGRKFCYVKSGEVSRGIFKRKGPDERRTASFSGYFRDSDDGPIKARIFVENHGWRDMHLEELVSSATSDAPVDTAKRVVFPVSYLHSDGTIEDGLFIDGFSPDINPENPVFLSRISSLGPGINHLSKTTMTSWDRVIIPPGYHKDDKKK